MQLALSPQTPKSYTTLASSDEVRETILALVPTLPSPIPGMSAFDFCRRCLTYINAIAHKRFVRSASAVTKTVPFPFLTEEEIMSFFLKDDNSPLAQILRPYVDALRQEETVHDLSGVPEASIVIGP